VTPDSTTSDDVLQTAAVSKGSCGTRWVGFVDLSERRGVKKHVDAIDWRRKPIGLVYGYFGNEPATGFVAHVPLLLAYEYISIAKLPVLYQLE